MSIDDLKQYFKEDMYLHKAALEFGEYRHLYLSSIISGTEIIRSILAVRGDLDVINDIDIHLKQIKKDVIEFIKFNKDTFK